MNKKGGLLDELKKSPDGIYASYNIIRGIKEVKKFRKWLKDYHKINDDEALFKGYRFFSEVVIRRFIDSIIMDSSLGIDDDFTFFRAKFVGVPIEDIPNTCEKVILLKNIWKCSKSIKKSENWDELEKSLKEFDERVGFCFEKIFNESVAVSKRLVKSKSKEEILKILSIFDTHIFLVDTSRGVPHGYNVPILKWTISPKYAETTFEGYKFALQFIWYTLLGEDFDRYSVKDLHIAEKIVKEEDLISPLEGEIIKREGKTIEDQEVKTSLKWKSIDQFFHKIQKEIVEPMEQELHIQFGFEKLLSIKSKINKKSFGMLLSERPQDPEYLTRKDKESVKKRLDYFLFWYPDIEILGTSKSLVFNGVPAFISAFIGLVEIKRRFGIDEKVYVIRFKHPSLHAKGNDYSYGVLVEAAGSSGISDYSGWLIFYNCCTDYSGFGGSEHAFAEEFIERYEKDGLIEVREFKVDAKQFDDFLADKASNKELEFIKERELETLEKDKRDRLAEARGILLELLLFYGLSKDKASKIEWGYKRDGVEIDIITKKEDEIRFIECKNPIEIEKDNLKKKVDSLLKNSEFKKDWKVLENTRVRLIYCFWKEPSYGTKKLLDNLEIESWILENKLQEIGAFRGKKIDKMKFIFSAPKQDTDLDFEYLQ